MPFICPECDRQQVLHIRQSITLPPDSRSDDILVQIVSCESCGFRAAAVYEESRRGSMDSESWDHTGYRLGRKELTQLGKLIRSCPSKKNKRCTCASHKTLSRTNEYGRWQLPDGFDWNNTFPMRLRT
jgi:hypothetical protein